jgi:hypothetical protein
MNPVKLKDNKKETDTQIDHLLQKTLKDDIPQDVEISMKEQLKEFRRKMEKAPARKAATAQKVFRDRDQQKDIQWIHVLFKKEILVVVSLLMIVLGGFIQSSGSSNSLTENLSALGTSVVVSNEMNRSHSMECAIQVPRDDQKSLYYSIQWLSSNQSKIQIKEPDNTPLKTIWLSEEDIIIADHLMNRVYKKRRSSQIDDPMIQPVMGFLAPMELADRMSGEWKFLQTERKGECDLRTFTVSLPNESAHLEVTVDHCTYLPITIKKILPAEKQGEDRLLLKIQYSWNAPLSPEHLSPKQTNESQKA